MRTKVSDQFDSFGPLSVFLVAAGILLRVVNWAAYLPTWRTTGAFVVLNRRAVPYLADFTGYKFARLPFYDLFAAVTYAPFADLLGVRGLSLFALLVGCLSVPVFYSSVERAFGSELATASLVFYALYPKLVVLTAIGQPEAPAVSFVVFSWYTFVRARERSTNEFDGRTLLLYLLAGVFSGVAILIWVASVVFPVLLTLYTYAEDVRETVPEVTVSGLLPSPPSLSVAAAPGVVGVSYLVFGRPLSTVPSVLADRYMFESRNILVNALKFPVYVNTDFWWHLYGRDVEGGILRIGEMVQSVAGPLFLPAVAGWLVTTGTLSLLAIVGLYALVGSTHRTPAVRDRLSDRLPTLIALWVVTYVGIYTIRNVDWVGSFRTYHVFPLLPGLAISFGIGLLWVSDSVERVSVVKLSVVALLLLSAATPVHGVIRTDNQTTWKVNPVQQLQQSVDPEDSVAVLAATSPRSNYHVIQYSEGEIWPVIVAQSEMEAEFLESRSGITRDARVIPPNQLVDSDIDYLIVLTACRGLRPTEQTYLNASTSRGATVVYEGNGTPRCPSESRILRL